MRAMKIFGARRAARTGALSLTIIIAALVLGSLAAGALAAQSGSRATATTRSTSGTVSGPAASEAAASRLVVHPSRIARPSGSTVVVHGFLHPGEPGATIRLVTRLGRGWRTLAIGRTLRDGRFGIRYHVRGAGATPIRVAFAGTRRARAASAAAGKIVALAPIVASWYDDAGNTACGFHAAFGVANKTLACGTKVTLSYGGRSVVATVDDRGPYVYGRSFDLNQNTARYLRMWGVGEVFASV